MPWYLKYQKTISAIVILLCIMIVAGNVFTIARQLIRNF